ncbi:hypothetical protein [Streptococcus suis]|uniref:hypothetical protein n=1 Tax=Streptococcus suis TaxID=1307 RepID=UPI001961CF76|nr:hypothetical protein [Streptococcus suis]MBM7191681.1 hypothetical protein [Streptococcus suis]MCO8223933.1 hypothetical protein [Streptococcus suis]HEM3484121.1 hypothetical protein [Streptococcus suis]
MSNKLLTTEQIYQQIELYCLSNNILYEEEQIDEWANDLLNIIYSIGGAPTSLIVEKMLPEYITQVNIN